VCRLVSATHLAGERGDPVCTLDLVAEHAAGRGVVALLGPGSEVGAATTVRREDLARSVLHRGASCSTPRTSMSRSSTTGCPGPARAAAHAARMLGLAAATRTGAVLSNTVRYTDRADAVVVDVLDAARRLVPLDLRHVDRGNAEGFLKSGKQMARSPRRSPRLPGPADARRPASCSRHTRAVADRCAVDPRADLGLGEVHFPEFG
jgi:error-prone DNA polymerase